VKALLVGAGAVGQVYGYHLQRGGAEVSFFVKEKYAAECRAGFLLYPLRRRTEPAHFRGFGVLTHMAEVAAERFDEVWLCVSSTALRGPWLDELLGASGDATVVALTPGLDDREYLRARCSEERIVSGVITLVSYQTPLPGERRSDPGVAYWFPPLSASPFDGAPARVREVVKTLRAGGCPAHARRNTAVAAAFASALMMPPIVALEAEGWSLRALRRGGHLALAAAAAREALRIVGAHHGRPRPAYRIFARGPMLRLLCALAPRFVPFDLEAYLAYHFTKVGDQTEAMMQSYLQRGRELGLPTQAIDRLAALPRKSIAERV
jgi:2-dehydropantoate 2-reductase